ncbi:hypothetical protein, partial [Holdemania massiliensis]
YYLFLIGCAAGQRRQQQAQKNEKNNFLLHGWSSLPFRIIAYSALEKNPLPHAFFPSAVCLKS